MILEKNAPTPDNLEDEKPFQDMMVKQLSVENDFQSQMISKLSDQVSILKNSTQPIKFPASSPTGAKLS